MNNLNKLILGLTLLIPVSLYSCEDVEVSPETQGRVIIENVDNSRGGDDDEDPIIIGIVSDGSGVPNAAVKLFEEGSSNPTVGTTTSAQGEFNLSAPEGFYYFEVTESNGNRTLTPVFQLTGNTSLIISI